MKRNIKLILWSMKLGFQTSPLFYTLLIFSNILNIVIPIIITFILAILINILIHSLSVHSSILSSQIIYLIALSILLRIIQNVITATNYYFITRVRYSWDIIQVSKFLKKLSSLDLEHRENQDVNLIITKLKDQISSTIRTTVIDIIPRSISQIIGLLTIAGIFLALNPILILLIFIPVIIDFFIDKKYGKDLYVLWYSKGEDKIHNLKARYALEDINAYKESKIYNSFEYIINKYKKVNENFQKSAINKLKTRTKFFSLSFIIDGVIFGGIQIWIISQVLNRGISIGLYSFYVLNLNTVITTLGLLAYSISTLISDIRYVSDYKDFLDIENKIKYISNPVKIKNEIPQIEFRNVSFRYPKSKNLVLDNISFKIEKGSSIAIVGRNGAGKSTIIKLLARFYDVSEGEILINNVNIKNIDLKSYYKLWGVLFQEYYLFWFSINENIALSNIDNINNFNLIKKTATDSDIDNDINKLNYKYDTLLDADFEKGTNLSGGQKQKVAIARALFRNPKFILLDEPSSSLDALSEERVFRNIYKITKNTTTLIISHRFSTVKNANRILVLDKGRIIEEGSHKELMNIEGKYKKMFLSQANKYR